MAVREQEREDAIARLRVWLKSGDTVYTILRHHSRSGMQRTIGVLGIRARGDALIIHDFSRNAASALSLKYDDKREGVVIGGCGMDMGFALVNQLASVLFGSGDKLMYRWL